MGASRARAQGARAIWGCFLGENTLPPTVKNHPPDCEGEGRPPLLRGDFGVKMGASPHFHTKITPNLTRSLTFRCIHLKLLRIRVPRTLIRGTRTLIRLLRSLIRVLVSLIRVRCTLIRALVHVIRALFRTFITLIVTLMLFAALIRVLRTLIRLVRCTIHAIRVLTHVIRALFRVLRTLFRALRAVLRALRSTLRVLCCVLRTQESALRALCVPCGASFFCSASFARWVLSALRALKGCFATSIGCPCCKSAGSQPSAAADLHQAHRICNKHTSLRSVCLMQKRRA